MFWRVQDVLAADFAENTDKSLSKFAPVKLRQCRFGGEDMKNFFEKLVRSNFRFGRMCRCTK